MRTELRPDGLYALVETFEWLDPQQPRALIFRTTEIMHDMTRGLLPFDRIITKLDVAWAREVLPLRGLDYDHAARLTPDQIAKPLLGVKMPSGATLLIDGHHRYYRRWQLCKPDVRFYVVQLNHITSYYTERTSDHDHTPLCAR